MKQFLMSVMATLFLTADIFACTGISLFAKDGSYIQARTIEWGDSYLPSEYVIIPRNQEQISYTPTGANGLKFKSKYGVVGLSIIQKEFIVEGINETGLSAGLFYFPHYGAYPVYDPNQNERTLSDLQFISWLLSEFSTIDEVQAAMKDVRIVSIDKPGATATVHWRIGEASGRQVVLEFMDGKPHFYENKIGVLTNAPDFSWQVTNLNNYVNLFPGSAPRQELRGVTLFPFGAGSGCLGIPGDVTPPSRFVRAAFYTATAPQLATGEETILQSFHILNNFDIPIGIEHPRGQVPDIPSATQWTSAVDLTHRKVYYKTAYNNTIRCIDLRTIDFTRVALQHYPLDAKPEQPIQTIYIQAKR